LVWKRSSRSIPQGECVEVAITSDRLLVRDSRAPDDAALMFPRRAWRAFLQQLNSGDLDPTG
jgi:hypothetical protein